MKRLASLLYIGFLLLALTFSSCENEPVDSAINLDPVDPPVLPAAFRVNFDGQTYIATQFNAVMNDGVLSIAFAKTRFHPVQTNFGCIAWFNFNQFYANFGSQFSQKTRCTVVVGMGINQNKNRSIALVCQKLVELLVTGITKMYLIAIGLNGRYTHVCE